MKEFKDNEYITIFEAWSEYDENNNLIHYKNNKGYEYWTKHDMDGNEIYYKDDENEITGTHEFEYDENGNEIYWKCSDGSEEFREYDENGNMIHLSGNNINEIWYKYDDNNNLIHYHTATGYNAQFEYTENSIIERRYDKNNELVGIDEFDYNKNYICKTDCKNNIRYDYKYDEYGKLIEIHSSDGQQIEYFEYDDRGNCIYNNKKERLVMENKNNLITLTDKEVLKIKEMKAQLKYLNDNIIESKLDSITTNNPMDVNFVAGVIIDLKDYMYKNYNCDSISKVENVIKSIISENTLAYNVMFN